MEPTWRSGWPGWTAPEETFYWCSPLGPGAIDPAWPPLSQISPCPERLLWLWGWKAQGTLTSAGEQPGYGRPGSIHVDKSWLPTRYDSVLVSMPVAREGVKFSGNGTLLTTISPTLPQCLPQTPADTLVPEQFFQLQEEIPPRPKAAPPGRVLSITREEGFNEAAARRWVWVLEWAKGCQ